MDSPRENNDRFEALLSFHYYYWVVAHAKLIRHGFSAIVGKTITKVNSKVNKTNRTNEHGNGLD